MSLYNTRMRNKILLTHPDTKKRSAIPSAVSHLAALDLNKALSCIVHVCLIRSAQEKPEVEEKKEEEVLDLRKKRDAQLEEEAQRLKEEVEKLRVEMEKLEESQKHWEERREEDVKEEEEEEVDEEKKKECEEDKRREEVEEIRRKHKKEMQSLVSEYSSAQTHLQTRIVALENE